MQTVIPSILPDPHENWSEGGDFTWIDESVDSKAVTMVKLHGEGFIFNKDLFVGGLTDSDLSLMTKALEKKEKKAKEKPDKDKAHVDVDNVDIANIISSQMKDFMGTIEDIINQAFLTGSSSFVPASVFEEPIQELQLSLLRSMKNIEATLKQAVEANVQKLEGSCMSLIASLLSKERDAHSPPVAARASQSPPGTSLPPTNVSPGVTAVDAEKDNSDDVDAANSRSLISNVLKDLNAEANPQEVFDTIHFNQHYYI